MSFLPGVHISPNIQSAPDVYEIENNAADPEQLIESAMWKIASWQGKVVVDLGSGTGFHLPRFHKYARHVIGVEPHGPSRLLAMERCNRLALEQTSVMIGSAEQILLPDHSVDFVHSRFAYFFGPGCEAGLNELQRIIAPGGVAFTIDNNLRHGTFATWLQQVPFFAQRSADQIDQFWQDQGYTLVEIASEWKFNTQEDLEAVIRLEFPQVVADSIMRNHTGLTLSYWYNLYWKRFS